MESRYNSIKDFDVEQSSGLSVSLWFQGCEHRCKGCHNPSTWDFNGGLPFTNETIETIIDLLTKDNIKKNLSILGGEPLSSNNIIMLTELLKSVKLLESNIEIWLWTGYNFENIKDLELINFVDVLIDGKYIQELHEITRFKGSSNQRIINVQDTLKQNQIILY